VVTGFRAENSHTSRHLAEFWMIEPEIAFADLSDNAALAEELLKYTFAALLRERQEDLAFFDQRIEDGLVAKLEGIVGSEFVHMDYGEAIQVLERSNEKFEFPVKWGIDLQSEHERFLTEKHAKKPVIVMNYPKAIKAFYMRLNDGDAGRGGSPISASACSAPRGSRGPGLTLRRLGPRFRGQGAKAMSSQSEVIETTVSKVAAELVRRGLDPEDRVTITIEPDELIAGRREARARVVAAGLTDEDIDRLIDEARTESQPLLE
jgi:hypothetical protein